MAKQAAAPQAAPAAEPTPAPSAPRTIGSNHPTIEVVEWGNGEPKGVTEQPREGFETPPEEAKPEGEKPAEAKPEGKGEPEADPEKPAEEPKPAAANAERRAKIREAIEAQKTKLAIEQRAKDEQKRASDAEAKLENLRKAPLAERLRFLFPDMSRSDITDRLLIGGDDVAALDAPAAKPAETSDPKVAALEAKIAELEKAQQTVAQREQEAQQAQAVARVKETLKDADIPVIDALDAHGAVLNKAYEAFMASGKAGSLLDYLPDAADIVEEEMRAKYPKIAAIADAAKGKKPEPKADEEETPVVAPPKPRAAMGKRTAARPESKPKPLPLDPIERDRAIKAEMEREFPGAGWR